MARQFSPLVMLCAALGAFAAVAGCGIWGSNDDDPITLKVDIDAPEGGDAKTWASAFRHPQDAVDVAEPGQEVWVAEGTYTKREATDTVVVAMKDAVAIYGGFAGTETERDQRDWETHVTSLDGEDVCYHVVIGASDTRLDGFTVTRGNAAGDFLDQRGGGMFNDSLTNLTVANCRFTGNSAGDGVYMSTAFGGGMRNGGVSSVRITRCVFVDNIAGVGGGMAIQWGSSVEVASCHFTGNRATCLGGGGIYSDSDLIVSNSTFSGNTADHNGGAISDVTSSSLSVHSSTFVGNEPCAIFGGGSVDVLSSCILWNNRKDGGNLELAGSITGASYSCIRGGWIGEGNIGEDEVAHDPLFVDPGYWHDNGTPADTSDDYWVDGDYHLSASSPCIDTGDPASTLTEDVEGNPRPAGSGFDMGAFEYPQ